MRYHAWISAALILSLGACAAHRQPVGPGATAAAQSALDRGIAALEAKDPEQASHCFQEAVALDPGSIQAQSYLGLALVRRRQYLAAAEAFERVTRLAPEQAQGFSNLGAVYLLEHRNSKAKVTLLKAIALDPELPGPYFCLGSLLLVMGDPEQGASYLGKGMALDPTYLARHSESMESVVVEGGHNPEGFLAFARVAASFGDVDRTLSFLEAARKAGYSNWKCLQDKAFDQIRSDPRFIGFPQRP